MQALKSLTLQSIRAPNIKPSINPTYTFLRAISSASKNKITDRIPPGSWDSHTHVTSPSYPLTKTAAYKPSLHSLSHLKLFTSTLAIKNIVLVQPSIYGTDNSCLLDALQEIGPKHGRGVIDFDVENVNSAMLNAWHRMGVRGVRLNFKSTGAEFTPQSLREKVERYAEVIKPFDWVIELFIDMRAIPMLADSISNLGVKFSVAHFGAPDFGAWEGYPRDPYKLPGFEALLDLLRRNENLYVKLSAAYRFEKEGGMQGIEAVAKVLLDEAERQVVFASDWPHTRFEGVDVKPFVEKCLDWSEERGVKDLLFRDNAVRLWSCDVDA